MRRTPTAAFVALLCFASCPAWALDAPTITATAKGPDQINLTWSAVTNPGYGYCVEIQSNADARYSSFTQLNIWQQAQNGSHQAGQAVDNSVLTYNPPMQCLPYWVTEPQYIDPQDGSAAQYIVFGLLPNTSYSFRVRSYSGYSSTSYSSYSSTATATTSNYAVHYVSPSGSAAWGSCTSLATPCSLATANTNAVAGQIVLLESGTYGQINPTNGGTSATNKLVFMADSGATATFGTQPIVLTHSYTVIDGGPIPASGAGGIAGTGPFNANPPIWTTNTADHAVIANVQYNGAAILCSDPGNLSCSDGTPTYSPTIDGANTLLQGNYWHDIGNMQGGGDLPKIGGAGSVSQYNHWTRGAHDTTAESAGNVRHLNNIMDGGWGSGIYIESGSDVHLVEGNVIAYVAASNAFITASNNGVTCNNGGPGVYKAGMGMYGRHTTFRRNLVLNCGINGTSGNVNPNSCVGIEVNGNAQNPTPADNGKVYNNVFWNGGGPAIWYAANASETNEAITNNVIHAHRGGNDSQQSPTPASCASGKIGYSGYQHWLYLSMKGTFTGSFASYNDFVFSDPWVNSGADITTCNHGSSPPDLGCIIDINGGTGYSSGYIGATDSTTHAANFANNLAVAPGFVSQGTDFHLAANSALIGAGAVITDPNWTFPASETDLGTYKFYAASASGAKTYYVDCNAADDTKDGQSEANAWKTISKVNGSTFAAGDSILLKKGCSWSERFTAPSAGSAGNPIVFDAYGSGALPIVAGAAGGNTVTVAKDYVTMRHFKATGAPSGYYDINAGTYAHIIFEDCDVTGGNALAVLSNNVTFNRCRFGASTHATSAIDINNAAAGPEFNYCIFDGIFGRINITNSTQAIKFNGNVFYGSNQEVIYQTTGTPTTQVTNSIFAGNVTSSTSKHVLYKTAGTLTVGNSILLPNGRDPDNYNWPGTADGGGNVYKEPQFKASKYPAITILRLDDYVNLSQYIAVSDLVHGHGWKMVYALNTNGVSGEDWTTLAARVAQGDEIVPHTRSHANLTLLTGFTLHYGAGTTATVSISGNHLTTTVDSIPDLDFDLTAYANITALVTAINTHANYTAAGTSNNTYGTKPANLADVSAVDIKGATPALSLDQTRYFADEIDGAIADIQNNLAGYTVTGFACPYDATNTTVQNYLAGKGINISGGNYTGSYTLSSLNLYNVFARNWSAYTTNVERDTAATMEFLSAAGGMFILYDHGNSAYSLANWTTALNAIAQSNVMVKTMAQASTWVRANGSTGDNRTWTQTLTAASDFTLKPGSPAIDAGSNLGDAYKMGLDPSSSFPWGTLDQTTHGTGWEIGAFVYMPARTAHRVLVTR